MKRWLASGLAVLMALSCFAVWQAPCMAAFADTRAAVADVSELPFTSYYGYVYLSGQDHADALLTLYRAIAEGVEQTQTGISVHDLTLDEMKLVYACYHADYPQHFWLDNQYSWIMRNGVPMALYPQYLFTGEELEEKRLRFENAVSDMVAGLQEYGDYDRALILHDRLVQRVDYANTENSHSAYGAIVGRQAVCEGYTRAYQCLLYRVGIQALLVTGQGKNQGHAWNMVHLEGVYAHVDVTWDDGSDDFIGHAYFGRTTQDMERDHIVGDRQAYSLPDCVSQQLQYHRRNGTYLRSFDVDTVVSVFRKGRGIAVVLVDDTDVYIDWVKNHITEIAEALEITGGYRWKWVILGQEVALMFPGTTFTEPLDEPPVVAGDVNGDGNITVADYGLTLAHVRGTRVLAGNALLAADVNSDGKVTVADYGLILAHVRGVKWL